MTVNSFIKRMPPETLFLGWIADGMEKAANCTKCGECETRCPYGLPIKEMLEEHLTLYQARRRKYQDEKASG